jgi:hypothetical protein
MRSNDREEKEKEREKYNELPFTAFEAGFLYFVSKGRTGTFFSAGAASNAYKCSKPLSLP